MTFIIHLSLIAFYRDLVKGSVVYSGVYSVKDRPGITLLLTSEVDNRVHAVQLTITDEMENTEVSGLDLIEDFFAKNDIILRRGGILLTDGLQNAIRYWGSALAHTRQELGEILELLREQMK